MKTLVANSYSRNKYDKIGSQGLFYRQNQNTGFKGRLVGLIKKRLFMIFDIETV